MNCLTLAGSRRPEHSRNSRILLDILSRLLQRCKIGTDPVDAALEMVGVDPADRAVSYAVDAGLLDAGVATNLENSEPTSQDVAAIETPTLSFRRDASVMLPRFHWNGFWRRASTAAHGWRIPAAHVRFRCRGRNAASAWIYHGKAGRPVSAAPIRFTEERQHVLDNLSRLGIDATGAEETGWYLAELTCRTAGRNKALEYE